MKTPRRRGLRTLSAFALLASGLVVSGGAGTATAAPTVVASDMVNSGSLNLTSHTNAFAGAFTSGGDGFEKYQRGVSSTIPFAVLDDSVSVFPPDSLGIIGEANTDEFFGVTDTANDDTGGASVSATWVFDISSATDPLSVSIDMGAMGDFEASDTFDFTYSIDGAPAAALYTIAADEAGSQSYTMDGGAIFNLNDPLVADGITLDNNLQTVTAPIAGLGSALTLTLTADTDGGTEAFALQNIIIASNPPPGPVASDMVNSGSLNLTSHTNAFAGAFTSGGDGFEKYQRGVSSTIPFAVLDDSVSVFPPDSLGIIGEANTDEFFGVTDTANDDTGGASVSATWVFDISSATEPLSVSIDMGAMGDFEASDTFDFTYSIDGAPAAALYTIAADEAGSQSYTMDGGAIFNLNDPLVADGITLDNNLQTVTAPIAGLGSALTLTLTADTDGGTEAFAFQNIIIGPDDGGGGPIGVPFGACGDGAETAIHTIQGSGALSPEEGNLHVIEGVVVGDFQGATELGGFFLQEEDGDADGDAATSEGIFVFDDGFGTDVDLGDVIRVKGEVDEAFGQTQLEDITDLAECADQVGGASSGAPTLPVAVDLEAFEGMSVNFAQTLYATDNFNWHRRGEVTLSVGGVLDNPTNVTTPGAAALALQDLNNRSQVQLDDGSSISSPALVPPYISTDGTLRRGDTVDNLTGALGYAFGAYEVHPTASVSFTRVNDRVGPPNVGGTIQVGAFNVLNYFTTIDTGASICGPNADQGCRGADSASEFTRQRDKIVDAIAELDAEVLGLMEIENAADNTPEADLVAGLNAVAGAGTYDYIATPGGVGSDAIRVAILYQPGEVTPIGPFAILDMSVDPLFNDDKNRAVLAQTFEENATAERFTVAVNHLKSKGSPCDDVGDPDAGDLQGNCNGVRTDAAEAQANWLADDPTGSGDPDFLITGDLNSYAQEDPIVALESAGYDDLIELFQGVDYSFTFFGQGGYLDHAMSSPSLTTKTTGAAFWHINADEPRGLDYNEEDNQPSLYNPDEWRASDHDPVIVGLDLATPRGLKTKASSDLAAMLPTGDGNDDQRIEQAIERIEQSLNPDYWVDDSTLDEKHGKQVFDRERQAVIELDKVANTDVQSAIDKLVDADRRLVTSRLESVIDAGGDPKYIARAQDHLAQAETEVADGDFAKAIEEFRKAWQEALRAVPEPPVRFATFNASLNRSNAGDLATELSAPGSPQPDVIAEIIQRSRPEVLLINEFDYDAGNVALDGFQANYLSVAHGTAAPIEYPYRYTAPSNTGVYSGFDLDNSGAAGDFVPNDSFGFGFFEGQYGMAVYSMYPIDFDDVRTFQNFLWKDMPGALLPDDPDMPEPADWYSAEELEVVRLSSKSHWDIPIEIDNETVHFLVSHPTPPVFDGPEDRNGTRNHDEIRFWADYVTGGKTAKYIYDDEGKSGGLNGNPNFVIAGDQNSDPFDGDSIPGAIQQLLEHPSVNTTVTPSSPGGTEQSGLQGGINASHLSDPAFDTADFSDFAPGNLRVDYVLPSQTMPIHDAGVFWPLSTDPLFALVGTFPFPSSDHRLVWVDVDVR